MCEILVKAVDAIHPDPIEDQRGCYKRGDIVDVRPDGCPWGKEEGLPRFFIVKIPGLSDVGAKQYMNMHQDISGKVITRRSWRIPIDTVPSVIKNKLLIDGVVSVNWTQIKGYLINKKDGSTAG